MSSIVVVPPLESIVKLPVDVSISLSPAIPIRILSMVAPPLASSKPPKDDVVVTFSVEKDPDPDHCRVIHALPFQNWNALSSSL